MTPPETSQAAVGELVARLRSTATLPVCPYDRRSPEYWTAPDDKPCVICGTENDPDKPDKCRGADTRIMEEAADLLETLQRRVGEYEAERDEAMERLGQLLGADPGPKYAAAAKAARDLWLAYDRACEAALDGKGPE